MTAPVRPVVRDVEKRPSANEAGSAGAEPSVRELADRLRADSEAAIHHVVRVKNDYGGFEVATGYRGIGVFVTVVSRTGSRLITYGLSEKEAARLGKALMQAAEASITHRQRNGEPE